MRITSVPEVGPAANLAPLLMRPARRGPQLTWLCGTGFAGCRAALRWLASWLKNAELRAPGTALDCLQTKSWLGPMLYINERANGPLSNRALFRKRRGKHGPE